jgi:hypothetical protein
VLARSMPKEIGLVRELLVFSEGLPPIPAWPITSFCSLQTIETIVRDPYILIAGGHSQMKGDGRT